MNTYFPLCIHIRLTYMERSFDKSIRHRIVVPVSSVPRLLWGTSLTFPSSIIDIETFSVVVGFLSAIDETRMVPFGTGYLPLSHIRIMNCRVFSVSVGQMQKETLKLRNKNKNGIMEKCD